MPDYNGVQNSELLGLVASTQAQLPPREITATYNYQHYEVVNSLFSKDKITEPMAGGRTAWTHEIILDDMGTASFVNPYGKTEVVARDVLSTASGPWAYSQFYFVMSREEVLENAGRAKLVDLQISKEASAAESYAKLREDAFFGAWDASADPPKSYTLEYWVPQLIAAQAGEGFYGGHTDATSGAVGGISPCTSGDNTTSIAGGKARWRSYQAGGTAYYTAVDDTLVETMDRTWQYIHFEKPNIVNGVVDHYGRNFRIYCNLDTRQELKELAAAYEGVGSYDLSYSNGELTFNGVPIKWIPALDSDTMDPIYMLNLNTWRVPVLNGMNMFRHEPQSVGSEQHNVFVTFVDKADQIICIDRRANACINKTA